MAPEAIRSALKRHRRELTGAGSLPAALAPVSIEANGHGPAPGATAPVLAPAGNN